MSAREDAVSRRAAAVFARALGLRARGPASRARWTARDLPGWDSLKHVELIVALEGAFRVRLPLFAAIAADRFDALLAAVRAALARKKR